MSEQPQRRVCVVGDDLVAGVGDARALGWVGRVAARTGTAEGPFGVLPLGVPGEGTSGLLERWREETSRRWLPDGDNRLVVGLGGHDLDQGTTLARSRLNLANILDDALARRLRTFVVGPPPGPDPAAHDRTRELAAAFTDVATRRGVPFVDCFAPLVAHDQWYADIAAGDGSHPGQVGYGLIAWLVLHGGWHEWLGVPQDA